MRRLCWLGLAAVALATAVAGVGAAEQQPAGKPPRSYRDLPFDGNLAAALRERLVEIKGLENFQDLLRQIRENQEAYKNLAKNQDLLKAGANSPLDPAMRQRLVELLKDNDDQLKLHFTSEQIETVKQMLKKVQEEKVRPFDSAKPDKQPKTRSEGAQPMGPPQVAGDAEEVENLAKRAMDWAENTRFARLGPMVQKSAAIQLSKQRTAGIDPLGKAIAKITRRGSNLSFPKLDWLKLPTAPAGRAPAAFPDLNPLSGLPALRWLSGTSSPGTWLADQLIAVVFGITAAVIAWKLFFRQVARRVAVALPHPGRRPFVLGVISTKEQFVQAFEHLALATLGASARTANHRAIAAGLGATPEGSLAANALANLYERVRYDPAEGVLGAAELASSRRDLGLLAAIDKNAGGSR